MGSFINVFADSFITPRNLFNRSHCDHCKRTLTWYELVPVFSYVVIAGTSLCCKRKLSVQYPIVEALAGVVAVLFVWQAGFILSGTLLFKLVTTYILLTIALVDLKHYLIPDELVASLFILGVVVHVQALVYFLPGALMISLALWFIYHFSAGRAMGFGDVKLMFAAGFILPSIYLLGALYSAFLTGAVVSVILMLIGKKRMGSVIPFGPFLVFGLILALWYT